MEPKDKPQRKRQIILAGIFGGAFLMISTILLTSSLRHQKNSEETSWHNLTSAIERLQQQNALLVAQVQHLREMEAEDNQNEQSELQPEQDPKDPRNTSSCSITEPKDAFETSFLIGD